MKTTSIHYNNDIQMKTKDNWTEESVNAMIKQVRNNRRMFFTDEGMYNQLIGWMKEALHDPDDRKHAEYFFNAIKELGK
jgi:hypothetical protein